jgi:hypothetical protein
MMIERENPTISGETSEVKLPDEMSDIFAQLDSGHVEQFYNHYQIWLKQRRLALVQLQITALQEAIVDNAELMQQTRPSVIALAALSQLQACGVDDIDLLDRMLTRGDTWLDQTMELLEQCERMGFIQDGYTLWCENALDGAFDWLISMNEAAVIASEAAFPDLETVVTPPTILKDVTEDLLLQRLMSEDEVETKKRPAITQPLAPIEMDFFSSLPVVPLPARVEDFFSSLPVVPKPYIEEIEPLTSDDINVADEMVAQHVPSLVQTPLSQELFMIASLHATPLPAPMPPAASVSTEASPAVQEDIIEHEQEIDTSGDLSEAATAVTADPVYEDNSVTESIPRISIGARVQPADEQTTGITEKVLVSENAPLVTTAKSSSSSWKWTEETPQYQAGVTQPDVPAHKPQATSSAVVKPRRKIGFFRRLLNWLLGRTPDY